MSDPVAMLAKSRVDWKRRAIRAELECEDLRVKLNHYGTAAATSALVAVACLLYALTK